MKRPAPRTLTPQQQRTALADGNRALELVLDDIDWLIGIARGRLEKSCDAIGSMPASGVDEIHGRTTQPAGEAGMEFIVALQQSLRDVLGLPPYKPLRAART